MTTTEEQAYVRGQRAVWLNLLTTCLRELGYDSPDANAARWVVEREQTVAALRAVCAEHGDNEWDDDLHLADVVDKHLGQYLARNR